MGKSDFAKLIVLGVAAGSLIGAQPLAADENEESRGDNFLASAGCKGPSGCGGNGGGSEYRHYTADNDAGFSQGSYYQGGASTGNTYYNTGSSTQSYPSSTSVPQSGYQGSSMTPSSGSTYYNTGAPSGSNPYQGGTTSPNYNRGSTAPSGTPNQYNAPSSNFNTPSTNNPTAYPDHQRNSSSGRYLAANEEDGDKSDV